MNSIDCVRARLLSLLALSACAGQSADVAAVDEGREVEGRNSRDPGACVSVEGSALSPWFDVDVAGADFNSYDGQRARVIVALNLEASRFGVGEATISGGEFALTMPAVRSAAYTEIGVYIDTNDSDGCDVGEPTWSYTTGGEGEDISLRITPSRPAPLRAVSDCTMNGWFDLEERLPCSAE